MTVDLSKYKFKVPMNLKSVESAYRSDYTRPQSEVFQYTVDRIDPKTCIGLRGENCHGRVSPVLRIFNAKLLTSECQQVVEALVHLVYPKSPVFFYSEVESRVSEAENVKIREEYTGRREYCSKFEVVRKDFCPSQLAFLGAFRLRMMYEQMVYRKDELWLVED